jgi:thymidylate synthase (FAD)
MAEQMFNLCLEIAPSLFRNAGPACIRGACKEGEKSCGNAALIRESRKALLKAVKEEGRNV